KKLSLEIMHNFLANFTFSSLTFSISTQKCIHHLLHSTKLLDCNKLLSHISQHLNAHFRPMELQIWHKLDAIQKAKFLSLPKLHLQNSHSTGVFHRLQQ